jgi:sarcosine oxidase subunit gamma
MPAERSKPESQIRHFTIRAGTDCMPEHPGFELRQIDGRSIVRLRVRLDGADEAAEALGLPLHSPHWRSGDPAGHWLGPDQWLLTSDTKAASEIVDHIGAVLAGKLHAATDMSSQNACFSLAGSAARLLLSMGCGIDMHPGTFRPGECVRTRFANVPLFIVAVEEMRFDLYVDRSYAAYFRDWINTSGDDPMTRETNHHLSA